MNSKISVFIVIVPVLFTGLMLDKARAVLPSDFPGIQVTTYTPGAVGEGYIFLAVASVTDGVGTYLMILDNNGDPVWYEKLSTTEIYDFKVNPNGYLSCAPFIQAHTYTSGGDAYHEIRDESYSIVESVYGKNGYAADSHDFQILPNGNLLQFGYYMSEVDMSQIVDGGHPGALVSGAVVQELDAQRNVVFQWRTWDHYPFEELTSNEQAENAIISAFELNTMNQDIDGNIILGTPSQILKISRQNGQVMWTLGSDDNEFTVIGAGADISHFGGHATHRIENGNFLMYDNGNMSGTISSKVHEYTLDEINKTATHVWSWEPTEVIPAWHGGNAQRLPNGNTFIGWGGANGQHIPACTEVTPAGDVVFQLYFDSNTPQIESYRAFRLPYPPASQAVSYLDYELAQGTEYSFPGTGITIDIDSLTAEGYNELEVTREPYAPVSPAFSSIKPPRVLPVRFELDPYQIDSISAEISFDTTTLGSVDPASLTIYHRTNVGAGLFQALADTNYNPVTEELRGTMTQFGEYCISYPDLADIPHEPILNQAENYRGVQNSMVVAPPKANPSTVYPVNQELEILLSWSPQGLARYNFVQVATDDEFNAIVLDQQWLTECRTIWSGANPGITYYWRARIYNEAGNGDWATGAFQTVPPMIGAKRPINKELVANGMDYLIQWEDNIAEDVTIDLYKGGVFSQTIATAPSDRAFEWQVLGLEGGQDYSIRITSSTNPALYDDTNIFSIDIPDGDLNGDGKSDLADFAVYAQNYLAAVPTYGDYNGDGVVDMGDLVIFMAAFLSHL